MRAVSRPVGLGRGLQLTLGADARETRARWKEPVARESSCREGSCGGMRARRRAHARSARSITGAATCATGIALRAPFGRSAHGRSHRRQASRARRSIDHPCAEALPNRPPASSALRSPRPLSLTLGPLRGPAARCATTRCPRSREVGARVAGPSSQPEAQRRLARRGSGAPRGDSSTGVAASARIRTSRHERPSRISAGRPNSDRGRDLDRLQDDPVAERRGGRHAVGAGQHRDDGELEDADVRRRRRQHGGHVDREQHRGRRADAGAAVEVQRQQQRERAEQLQPPGGELGAGRPGRAPRAGGRPAGPCAAARAPRPPRASGARSRPGRRRSRTGGPPPSATGATSTASGERRPGAG